MRTPKVHRAFISFGAYFLAGYFAHHRTAAFYYLGKPTNNIGITNAVIWAAPGGSKSETRHMLCKQLDLPATRAGVYVRKNCNCFYINLARPRMRTKPLTTGHVQRLLREAATRKSAEKRIHQCPECNC